LDPDPYQIILSAPAIADPVVIISLVAIVLLLMGSALLSGAEVAYFSLEPADLQELKADKSKTAAKVIRLLERPKRLLATLLIGINFLNIGVVVISTVISERLLNFGDPVMNFLVQVIAVTFLILLVAEVIPKIYSTQHPVKVAKAMAVPVNVLQTAASPLSALLIASTSFIDKRIKKRGQYISVDQLSHALELTSPSGNNEQEQRILEGIVKFGTTEVSEIMRSRVDITAFEFNTRFDKLLKEIIEAGYSRIPVYRETLDNIAGVLFVKDLLEHMDKPADFNWQSLINPAFFVPESKKLDDLLKEFQHKKIHLAVVVDEYGGTSGIVTLEDILEEIVGDISDEFDDEDVTYSKLDENNYVFEGKILLNDMFRVLNIDDAEFDEVRGDSDTLAGFILELIGRIPRKNEHITFNNYTFKIESADGRRIKRVKFTINRKEDVEKED
jgi:putative hemolysin